MSSSHPKEECRFACNSQTWGVQSLFSSNLLDPSRFWGRACEDLLSLSPFLFLSRSSRSRHGALELDALIIVSTQGSPGQTSKTAFPILAGLCLPGWMCFARHNPLPCRLLSLFVKTWPCNETNLNTLYWDKPSLPGFSLCCDEKEQSPIFLFFMTDQKRSIASSSCKRES